jgi:signal peptidase II
VIDFADLHFGDFRPFFIFNLADAAISIGVAIMLARAVFVRDSSPQDRNAALKSPSETI